MSLRSQNQFRVPGCRAVGERMTIRSTSCAAAAEVMSARMRLRSVPLRGLVDEPLALDPADDQHGLATEGGQGPAQAIGVDGLVGNRSRAAFAVRRAGLAACRRQDRAGAGLKRQQPHWPLAHGPRQHTQRLRKGGPFAGLDQHPFADPDEMAPRVAAHQGHHVAHLASEQDSEPDRGRQHLQSVALSEEAVVREVERQRCPVPAGRNLEQPGETTGELLGRSRAERLPRPVDEPPVAAGLGVGGEDIPVAGGQRVDVGGDGLEIGRRGDCDAANPLANGIGPGSHSHRGYPERNDEAKDDPPVRSHARSPGCPLMAADNDESAAGESRADKVYDRFPAEAQRSGPRPAISSHINRTSTRRPAFQPCPQPLVNRLFANSP